MSNQLILSLATEHIASIATATSPGAPVPSECRGFLCLCDVDSSQSDDSLWLVECGAWSASQGAVKPSMHLSANFECHVIGLGDVDAFSGFRMAAGPRRPGLDEKY